MPVCNFILGEGSKKLSLKLGRGPKDGQFFPRTRNKQKIYKRLCVPDGEVVINIVQNNGRKSSLKRVGFFVHWVFLCMLHCAA